jgi:hypothetical protein
MIALRRSDVADLNERARDRLREAGALGVEQVEPANGASPSATESSPVATIGPSVLPMATPAGSALWTTPA